MTKDQKLNSGIIKYKIIKLIEKVYNNIVVIQSVKVTMQTKKLSNKKKNMNSEFLLKEHHREIKILKIKMGEDNCSKYN